VEKQDHDHRATCNDRTTSPSRIEPEEEDRYLEWDEDDDYIDADGIEYITSDGEPMAETIEHRDLMMYFIQALQVFFINQEKVHVSGNDFIHYQRGDGNKYVSPDCYVVFGVGKEIRECFKVWEEDGHFPDVIFEFTSRKTRRQDYNEKKTLYEQTFKTAEYFIFDPTGKRRKVRMEGFRLVNGKYEEIPMQDGKMVSEQLGLHLVPQDRFLRLYDPIKQEFLPTHEEAMQQAVEERRRAEVAEAELARVRAEIEALRR
jgi:Uma2 family endonuclease